MSTRLFGQPVRRVEDPGILTGRVAFVDDLPLDGAQVEKTMHVAFVRSPAAHADIVSIDPAEALELAGVADVVTASDLGAVNGPHPHPTWFPPNDALRASVDPMVRPEFLEALASRRVWYAGAPVAAVVADDPYVAADALELVDVRYNELPAVFDADAALAPDASLLHPEWGDNVSARFKVSKGDVDAAFANADVVVAGDFQMARQTGTPMEPRGVVAEFDGERLTVWSSTQAPHWVRNALTRWVGLPADRIRVIAPHVGGGFGIKSMVYPEELVLALLAVELRGRLKWVETRSENFLAAVHSRDQRHHIELALTRDGRILGLRDRYVVDTGARNVEGLVVPYNTTAHLQGAYRIPALRVECTCVLTNKSPLSAYRGAGRPEAVFAMERALDLAARELGIDPLELRRLNLIGADEMPFDAGIPYRDGTRLVLDAGDVPASLAIAADTLDYAGWRKKQADALAQGRYIGIGLATYVEGTGIGPGESATIEILADGSAQVTVALPSQGQGHATSLAQICADRLGLPIEQVKVRQGDTALVERGGGTIASRTVTILGNSVELAATDLLGRMRKAAADVLEAAPGDLEVAAGKVSVKGAPQRAVSFAELAAAGPLVADGVFEPPGVTFASGAHAAVVEVDPWTGTVRILHYVCAHDCGRVVNPLIVDGQVVGGVAQGIGGALSEELVYDANGQLLTGSFTTYLVPRATDMPARFDVRHVETPSERNPLGIKGVGEAGTIGPPAAIAGAVEDALRPFGVTVTRCPLPPPVVAELVSDDALAGLSPRWQAS